MKIAILGTRGIPACYGGFETFAEELSVRLVERGHQVVVYGRKHVIEHPDPSYKGVDIRLLWAPRHKYFETPVHSLLCFLNLIFRRVDIALVCNAANSPFLWILKLARIPVVVNVDGIERERAKWNLLGRLLYRLGEFTSCLWANVVISDAQVIRRYYLEQHKTDSLVIPYGFTEVSRELIEVKLKGEILPLTTDIFHELAISAGSYILYVSRLEPENNAHVVIEAYNGLPAELKRSKPLVIVGDAPYARDYIAGLKQLAGESVIFTGYRFGEAYQALQLGAYLYVQATEVGGTHPALVEAMGYANCVIANKTPENIEVLSDAGKLYEKNNSSSLSKLFEHFISNPKEVYAFRVRAFEHAQATYSWTKITSEYEDLFASELSGNSFKEQIENSGSQQSLTVQDKKIAS